MGPQNGQPLCPCKMRHVDRDIKFYSPPLPPLKPAFVYPEGNTMTDTNEDAPVKTDALGCALVLGGVYGYSSGNNGFISTVIGRLEKVNAKKATIRIIKRRHFLWGESSDRIWDNASPTASVYPAILFPLSEDQAAQQV